MRKWSRYWRAKNHEREKPVRVLSLRLACALASLPVEGMSVRDLADDQREEIRRQIVEAVETDYSTMFKVKPKSGAEQFRQHLVEQFQSPQSQPTVSGNMRPGGKPTSRQDLEKHIASLPPTKLPTNAQLDALSKELRMVFEGLSSRDRRGAYLPEITVDLVAHNIHGDLEQVYKGDFRSVFLLYMLRQLQEFGVESVRKCAHCGRFFVANNPKQIFCERACVEADKTRRYKRTPNKAADYNEDHALLMWKKNVQSANGKRPSPKTVNEWLQRYRLKRTKRKLPVSRRELSEVLSKL